jgi:hypothetical protein
VIAFSQVGGLHHRYQRLAARRLQSPLIIGRAQDGTAWLQIRVLQDIGSTLCATVVYNSACARLFIATSRFPLLLFRFSFG